MNLTSSLFFTLLLSSSILAIDTHKPCDDLYAGLTHDDLLTNLKKIVKQNTEEINPPTILKSSRAMDSEQLGTIGKEIFEGLNQRMIGHEDVKYALAQAVQRAEVGTNNTTKPVSTMMLLGLTGTGKSLTAEVLHETLGLSPKNFIVVDSGEIQKQGDIAKLTGAPAGYEGHGKTPPMITHEKLQIATSKRYNVNVVLIDEIEKASEELRKILLGVLDKGRLTTGENKTIDFTKTIVIMTSNLGQAEMHNILNKKGQSFGFKTYKEKETNIDIKLDEAVKSALKKTFSPEFRNRIDKTFVFKEHTRDEALQILNMNLAKVQRNTFFKKDGINILYSLDPDARAYMMKYGYQSEFGGRSIKRSIEHLIVEPLTNLIGSHHLKPGDMVSIKVTDGKLTFHKTAENLSFNQMGELFTNIYGENPDISANGTKNKISSSSKSQKSIDNIRYINPIGELTHQHKKALKNISKMNDYSKIFGRTESIAQNSSLKILTDSYVLEIIKLLPASKKHIAKSGELFVQMHLAGYGDYRKFPVSAKLHVIWKSLSRLDSIATINVEKIVKLKTVIDESIQNFYTGSHYNKEFITDLRLFMNDLHLKLLDLPARK